MKGPIVVAGSGKMARDVGLYFIARGHDLVWLSRDAGRLAFLEKWIAKKLRRIAAWGAPSADAEAAEVGAARFQPVAEADIPDAALLIESINEAEDQKRQLMAALSERVGGALLLSNSSSILPDRLHEQCAGLHFFYPVELTGFVETIFPESYDPGRRDRLLRFLAGAGLRCIVEDARAAFAANRLLLPVQTEAVRRVAAGCDPAAVDSASVSSILPAGQLTLMDTIGLDVVGPAVVNVTARMEAEAARLYAPLLDGLRLLLDAGKRGRKNRDGIIRGAALPWCVDPDADNRRLEDLFRCLFVNTCHHALEEGLLAEADLALVLDGLFGWDRHLDEALAPLTRSEAAALLGDAFNETNLLYFVPARALRDDDATQHGWPEPRLMI